MRLKAHESINDGGYDEDRLIHFHVMCSDRLRWAILHADRQFSILQLEDKSAGFGRPSICYIFIVVSLNDSGHRRYRR